jgi:hypothetical protein
MTLTAALTVLSLSQTSIPHKVERAVDQHIVFGEDLIEGTLKSPEVEAIQTYRPPKFGNLIKVRSNFDDKIIKSVEQM